MSRSSDVWQVTKIGPFGGMNFLSRKDLRPVMSRATIYIGKHLPFGKGQMMSLTVRRVVVLRLIGIIFLLANILVVANWISDTGIAERADWLRKEFLTGTAVAVILVLPVLLVSPENPAGRAIGFSRRCPVCDERWSGNVNYCTECGSKV